MRQPHRPTPANEDPHSPKAGQTRTAPGQSLQKPSLDLCDPSLRWCSCGAEHGPLKNVRKSERTSFCRSEGPAVDYFARYSPISGPVASVPRQSFPQVSVKCLVLAVDAPPDDAIGPTALHSTASARSALGANFRRMARSEVAVVFCRAHRGSTAARYCLGCCHAVAFGSLFSLIVSLPLFEGSIALGWAQQEPLCDSRRCRV